MPERIQRRRTKGWRLPPDAIYVGRPSRWGNPYHVGGPSDHLRRSSRESATAAFRDLYFGMFRPSDEWMATWLAPLRGHDLACWCPEECGEPVALFGSAYGDLTVPCAKPRGHADWQHDPDVGPWCHADVLLELANA